MPQSLYEPDVYQNYKKCPKSCHFSFQQLLRRPQDHREEVSPEGSGRGQHRAGQVRLPDLALLLLRLRHPAPVPLPWRLHQSHQQGLRRWKASWLW